MMRDLLKSKFGDCKFALSSLCGNKSSYENVSEREFYIFDPVNETNQPVKIVAQGEDYPLKITNDNRQEVCVVKTDKCLFNSDHQKCDCILFDTNKFFLVEIKSSGKNTRREQRLRAVEQLGASIDILVQNGITLNDYDVKAIICFKTENDYPIQPSLNTRRAIFLDKYKISLEEGNKIEF